MSWVLGFGRQAEVLEPEHLREAVGRELEATMGIYMGEPTRSSQEEAEERTW
jgi:predicted DNA-binding transcriptional regulator YafY